MWITTLAHSNFWPDANHIKFHTIIVSLMICLFMLVSCGKAPTPTSHSIIIHEPNIGPRGELTVDVELSGYQDSNLPPECLELRVFVKENYEWEKQGPGTFWYSYYNDDWARNIVGAEPRKILNTLCQTNQYGYYHTHIDGVFDDIEKWTDYGMCSIEEIIIEVWDRGVKTQRAFPCEPLPITAFETTPPETSGIESTPPSPSPTPTTQQPQPHSGLVSDGFGAQSLGNHWTWVDPDDDGSYSLAAHPGWLRLITPYGDNITPRTSVWHQNCDAGRMMQTATGDFIVETKVELINPANSFQFGGILVFLDNNNHVGLNRGYSYGHSVGAGWAENGEDGSNVQEGFNASPTWLRMERDGNTFSFFYSSNGASWQTLGSKTFNNLPSTILVGLVAGYANNRGNPDFKADFDYFRLIEDTGVAETPESAEQLVRRSMGSFVRDKSDHLGPNEEHIYTYSVGYDYPGEVYGSYRFAVTVPIDSWHPVVTISANGETILETHTIDEIPDNGVAVVRIPEGQFFCTNVPVDYEITVRGQAARDSGDYTISFFSSQSMTKDTQRCLFPLR